MAVKLSALFSIFVEFEHTFLLLKDHLLMDTPRVSSAKKACDIR